MSIDADIFRNTMRYWATGVAVVTAAHDGTAHGMTVSSLTPVSVAPPQALISLAANSRTHALVSRSRAFGATILDASQQDLADRFAGRIADELDRMAGLDLLYLASDIPLLRHGLARFECRVIQVIACGSNTLFIGDVIAASGEGGDPLLYFNRAYQKLAQF
jgi:3-hydroxy-9,10-secoandrosta-1,3,5(10)-triene-9,17-dione monooxygenase reductase component